MWGFGLLRLAYFETLQGATGASEDQQDDSRSVMPTATDRSTVNPSVQQKSAKQNTSERQKPSEEPSEKSKATVKQTSVEPSTKKVTPVKQTSAEPSTKKVEPPEPQYGIVNFQQRAKKAAVILDDIESKKPPVQSGQSAKAKK